MQAAAAVLLTIMPMVVTTAAQVAISLPVMDFQIIYKQMNHADAVQHKLKEELVDNGHLMNVVEAEH